MKVVFVEQVEGSGYPGDVKDVANGFARNYLLPRGLAVPANASSLQHAKALAGKEHKRQEKVDSEANALEAKLEGVVLRFEERVGEQGRLFGSVTVSHIADKLSELLGEEFDRHKVLLADPLRELGRFDVRLRLSRNVEGTIPVEVIDMALGAIPTPEAPEMPVAEAPAAEAETPDAAEPKPKRKAKVETKAKAKAKAKVETKAEESADADATPEDSPEA